MQRLFQKTAPPIFLMLAAAGSLFATSTTGIAVWPLPSQYSYGNKVLWMAEDVQITYKTINDIVMFRSFFYTQGFFS